MLAHAIVKEGAKSVAAGMNPMDLKRGVDLAVGAIVEDLKKHSKAVTSNEEIAQVATISANGDSEIGRFIADASTLCSSVEACATISSIQWISPQS